VKKILVIYYSQTGQLKNILNSILLPFINNPSFTIHFEEIKPKREFSFPWKILNFFDAFPESVLESPIEIEPISFNTDEDYDLIILGYQPWYLSPSLPVTSFLQTEECKKVFNNRNIVTVIGCRNMWLMSQEKIKKRILNIGGKLVGNIALCDKTKNLISVVTISYWMFRGKKQRFIKFFPQPGISDKEIDNASTFGTIVLEHLINSNFENLQKQLIEKNAVKIYSDLMFIEKKAIRLFYLWAKFITNYSNYGSKKRSFFLSLFIIYLFTALYIISPFFSVYLFLAKHIRIKAINRETSYFSQNTFK